MEALRTLQVRISGERNKQPLRPQDLDIDELIKALEYSRDLIAQDGKSRPHIHVEVEEGSVLLKLTTAAMLVISTQALLAEVQKTHDTTILAPKQATALAYFDALAHKEGFEISFGAETKEPALKITRETVLEETEVNYLDRLIAEATPYWASIEDTSAWLKSIRGYNHQVSLTSTNPSN